MDKDRPVALIITDNFPTKMFLRNHLEKNYHLIEKKNFDEAIQIAQTTNLDIVIIDDNIENAIELCFQMKKRKRLFTVPIILITGSLKKSYKEKATKAGIFDCLYTPLKEEDLLSLLQRCEEEKNKIKKVSSISFKLKKNHQS